MANILVIDDDEDIRDLLEMMLIDDHHSVTTAIDGQHGMGLYRLAKFDLIITDIIMPNQDGIDVIADIMNSDNKTPIIAISGGIRKILTSEFNLQSAWTMGVQEILKKPFSALQLRHAVGRTLAGHYA